ncbi:hypothetical protein ADIARSV_2314 [Arcticibacter svalbardensis MN12-7]|uniref:Periplasmic heavy metal sensor n=1 Tax=Arcticibacter svalbardensis MN12-7 TaxID=1150600 RepID=R9GRZ2_9SPHI|nr:periplasmic heavy metal sensor [Arcticibacter svalbardensis]EOR94468.1 hypothetical protein ADIARSV_2314 [Arcticibacter svalbardensis MN12-7]
MSKIKILSIAVIGLLLINAAIVGFLLLKKPPHLPQGRQSMANEGPKQIITERLNFNAQQADDYDKLITAHQVSMRALEDSMGLLKNKLYQTLNNASFAGKDSLINELGTLQKQIEQINYDHFVALKKLCKPDQLDKFNKLTNELARFFATGKKDALPPARD